MSTVNISINTTQNVNINFEAATVGERMLAYSIDWLVKLSYVFVSWLVLFNVFDLDQLLIGMDSWSRNSIIVFFYLPVVFYSLIFESIIDGQTIGKRVMKIKVVKIDGYQASFPDFLVRWFFRIVDLNMMSGIVAIIAIVTNKNNQRLGDMTAGTGVIALKNKINISHTILENLKADYVPTYPNVIRLSDNDARIIKDTFVLAKNTKDYQTLIKLREKIIEVVEVKSKKENNDIDFISTILKDYNYYTQNM